MVAHLVVPGSWLDAHMPEVPEDSLYTDSRDNIQALLGSAQHSPFVINLAGKIGMQFDSLGMPSPSSSGVVGNVEALGCC